MPDCDWVLYKQLRGKALPENAQLLATTYVLEKTLKRDFYAVTGVYRRVDKGDTSCPERVLLKIYHTGPLGRMRMRWLGRLLCRRETAYLKAVKDVDGVPHLLGSYRSTGLVREYIPGCDLKEFAERHVPDATFFPQLTAILQNVHARGIAHNDLSKPENVLVRDDGAPILIDFQIALKLGWAKWPIVGLLGRLILRRMQKTDRYHLRKQHSRRRPMDFTPQELAEAKNKGLLLTLHGWLLRRPYRAVRHLVLRKFMLRETPVADEETKQTARAA